MKFASTREVVVYIELKSFQVFFFLPSHYFIIFSPKDHSFGLSSSVICIKLQTTTQNEIWRPGRKLLISQFEFLILLRWRCYHVVSCAGAVQVCDLKLMSFVKKLGLSENSKPYHIILRKRKFKNHQKGKPLR